MAQKLQQLGRWTNSCEPEADVRACSGGAPAGRARVHTGLSTEGLTVGGRTVRIPWHQSSPTCLGTKPLCVAGPSLTFLRHCSGDRRQQRERSHQAPPPNLGTHCHGHRAAAPSFPSWLLHTCPSYPQAGLLQDQRDGTMVRLGQTDPEHHFKNPALIPTRPGGLSRPFLCFSLRSFRKRKGFKTLDGSLKH